MDGLSFPDGDAAGRERSGARGHRLLRRLRRAAGRRLPRRRRLEARCGTWVDRTRLPAGALDPGPRPAGGRFGTAFAHWLDTPAGSQDPAAGSAAAIGSGAAAVGMLRVGAAALVDWWVDTVCLFRRQVPAVTAGAARRSGADRHLGRVRRAVRVGCAAAHRGRGARDTTLGAAVRRFFLQGGRKCYVVRVGDPWPLSRRRKSAASLIRVSAGGFTAAGCRSLSWRGVGHLFGLPDVSFLCMPDLPELFAVTPVGREKTDGEARRNFVECAHERSRASERALRGIPAPRCDETGFQRWAAFVAGRRSPAPLRREVQLVAACRCPWMTLP